MRMPRIALLIALGLLAVYVWANYQPEAAGVVPPPWDKLAHSIGFAALAGLFVWGMGRRAWPWVLAEGLLFAGWDEWHQLALPGRSPDLGDWMADAVGTLAGIGLALAAGRKRM